MSLQFNVSQLLKGGVGDTRTYEFDSDEPLDLDGAEGSNIAGSVKFTLTNFGIVAAIRAHAELLQTCARCLEPFRDSRDISFAEEYQPTIDIASGLPSTAPRNDAASKISSNHIIDLTDAIRENLLVSIELIPVCSPDCRGLCPSCGQNLNLAQCACPPAEEASPFAVLQGLLGGKEGE